MPDGARKMSSSKVIKPSQIRDQIVCSFDYGTLADGSTLAAGSESDEFVPLQIRECRRGQVEEVLQVALEEETLPQEPVASGISEDELQAQLADAYSRGLEEGRRQAERGLGNVFKALRDGVTSITGLRDRMLRDSEDDLLKLTIMVARKVIQQELALEQKVLANIINAALSTLTELDRVTIRLNPTDYGAVNANRHIYLAGVGEETQIVLTPDENIEPGGCMVDTATGTVDARIEVQLDEIYRQFLEQRSLPQDTDAVLVNEDGLNEP